MNCQQSKAPKQEITIAAITMFAIVSLNMYTNVKPNGALEFNKSTLGTIPAITFVDKM